jgi:hypothetical protein
MSVILQNTAKKIFLIFFHKRDKINSDKDIYPWFSYVKLLLTLFRCFQYKLRMQININTNLKQKKYILFLLILPVNLFFQSCIYESKTNVSYYDLGYPAPVYLEGITLNITPFLNYSEVSSEMLYRVEKNKINYDSTNRWAKSPNILLTTFFKNSLKGNHNFKKHPGNQPVNMTLCGAVTAFDIDLQNKKTVFEINYKIRYKGKIILVQNKVFERKFNKENPSIFASSMSSSATELLKIICIQLEELKDKIIKEDNCYE